MKMTTSVGVTSLLLLLSLALLASAYKPVVMMHGLDASNINYVNIKQLIDTSSTEREEGTRTQEPV